MDKDERFKHVATDPKFRRIPKLEKKVKIDKRFHGMFKDEKFKIKYTIDKRGRPVNHSSNNDLKRYYELSSSESEIDSDDETAEKSSDENETARKSDDIDEISEKSEGSVESDEANESTIPGKFIRPPKDLDDLETNKLDLKKKEKSDKKISNAVKKKLKNLHVDYARGEGRLAESSSDDESEEDEEDNDSSIEHEWGELDRDAETTDEITKRLAICNMDWDRIRAVDLMVLFNSFLPPGGLIESVTIYPSEFGKQRMKEEEIKGPTELVNMKPIDSDEEETEEGSKYHMEKLRQYQLNRLKYYYGVAIFDSPETANKIYTECDGLEYESSATKMDLRFIPDDTTFDDEPKEKCEKIPELQKYLPRTFTTTALQQAKVQLTWDETKPERLEIAKKLAEGKVDDVTETDLQAYLASSSEEDSDVDQEKSDSENDENPKDSIEKYRALLNDIEKSDNKKNKDFEMEVTWELNSKNDAQKLVKKKMEENIEKTPFQQLLDKRKEKRKQKKLERKSKTNENSNDEENDSESDSDNLVDSDDEVDMNDPYFAEEFNNSEFRKTKNKKSKSESKQKVDSEDEQEKAQLELLMLDHEEDGKKHFSLKKLEAESKTTKKKKKKSKNLDEPSQVDDFQLDVKDPRFSAIYTSHHYNIDPTDSHYKKTKGMELLIEEKQKRINSKMNDDDKVVEEPPKKKSKSELNALVNSVKRKTKEMIKKKEK